MTPPQAGADGAARFRIHALTALSAAQELRAVLNGTPLEPTENVGRIQGYPFDEMISPRAHRRAWTCPATLLTDGPNRLDVTLAAGDAVKIIYADAERRSR